MMLVDLYLQRIDNKDKTNRFKATKKFQQYEVSL